jgi:endonuclease YncB( thermonuclease family)
MDPDSAADYLAVAGELVIVGDEPDGNSIRFRADDQNLWRRIEERRRPVRLAPDGTARLRLEGADAPEARFGGTPQPLGAAVAGALLARLGFKNVEYAAPASNRVVAATPATVRAVILTRMVEATGRPVSYLLLDGGVGALPGDGSTVTLDQALLERTVNAWLLRQGLVYLLLYGSTPPRQRAWLQAMATAARAAAAGVWMQDVTEVFKLDGPASIGPGGQLVHPKLFRRAVDHLHDVDHHGFDGSLVDWLLAHSGPGPGDENDQVSVAGADPIRLSELLRHEGEKVTLSADLLDLVFVEK